MTGIRSMQANAAAGSPQAVGSGHPARPVPSSRRGRTAPRLILETATVRVAVFAEGGRLLTVRATCFGPVANCTSARLVPRRHAAIPEDGLWDFDLVCEDADEDDGPLCWRDLVFTGEADWCEGVRLYGPGGVLEHRMDPHSGVHRRGPYPVTANRTAGGSISSPRRTDARSGPRLGRLALDGVAALSVLTGLFLLPMSLPARAAEPQPPVAAGTTALAAPVHAGHGDCRHGWLLPGRA